MDVITARPPAGGREPSDDLLYAWRDAVEYSQEHGDEVAPPYIDVAANKLILPAKTPKGLEGTRAAFAQTPFRKVSTVHRQVKYSLNELEKTKHDVTTLEKLGVPGADAIFAAEVDPDNNRVLISADNVTTDLLKALRARYGPGKVAVSREKRLVPELLSRVNDTRPFYGGAAIDRPYGWSSIYACTSGFAYQKASSYYLLTAGHCATAGGSFQTPTGTVLGYVKSGQLENYDKGVGTVKLNYSGAVLAGRPYKGDRNMLGDIAIIPVTRTGMSAARIYTGDARSSASAIVAGVRPTYRNSEYCFSGRYSFQQCGGVVDRLAMDIELTSGEWTRNVNRGYDWRGKCAEGGDSGGPVYWRRPDGHVDARGILNAGFGTRGDGTSANACWHWFTDVHRSYDAWGGRVITVTP